MTCPGAAVHYPHTVTCALEVGHAPPHYDSRLGVWWSIPPHVPAEGSK